jgi:hypothetical protein
MDVLQYVLVAAIIGWAVFMVCKRIISKRGCCSDNCLCDCAGKRHNRISLKQGTA